MASKAAPVTQLAGERCETCRFWLGEKMVPEEPYPVMGKCKRRAPVATGGMMSPPETIWPQTGIKDWCGEYQEKSDGK